ncbi:uncharacterized protein METZ01_LOCUS490415, partial [marine metagenome]
MVKPINLMEFIFPCLKDNKGSLLNRNGLIIRNPRITIKTRMIRGSPIV